MQFECTCATYGLHALFDVQRFENSPEIVAAVILSYQSMMEKPLTKMMKTELI